MQGTLSSSSSQRNSVARRDPVRVEERIAHALVGLAVAPGQAELQLVLADVHVDAAHAEHVGGAGAADRRLEARVARDHLVGQDAAVAVAAERRGARDRRRPASRRGRRPRARRPCPCRPSRRRSPSRTRSRGPSCRAGWRDHGIAVRGEHLPVLHELVAELVHRPAVDAQDRRVARARRRSRPASRGSRRSSVPSALLNVISSTGASLRSFSHSLWSRDALRKRPAGFDRLDAVRMQVVRRRARRCGRSPRRRSRSRSAGPS